MDIHNPSVRDELPGKNCIKLTCDNCDVQKYQEQVMKENITLIRALQRVSWQQRGGVKYIVVTATERKRQPSLHIMDQLQNCWHSTSNN